MESSGSITTRPALAGILSFICPGLGDLYAGNAKRACFAGAAFILLRWLGGTVGASNWFAMWLMVGLGLLALYLVVKVAMLGAQKAQRLGARKPLNIGIALFYVVVYALA